MAVDAAHGLRLRAWRTDHNLTQKQLAKHLGVAWLTVQRWETGHRAQPSFLYLALERLDEVLARRGLVAHEPATDPW